MLFFPNNQTRHDQISLPSDQLSSLLIVYLFWWYWWNNIFYDVFIFYCALEKGTIDIFFYYAYVSIFGKQTFYWSILDFLVTVDQTCWLETFCGKNLKGVGWLPVQIKVHFTRKQIKIVILAALTTLTKHIPLIKYLTIGLAIGISFECWSPTCSVS